MGVPVEIKPTSNYSVSSLKAFITNQLCRKYMKEPDVKFGVFLLIRNRRKTWTINGKPGRSFPELVQVLKAHAKVIGNRFDRMIRVVPIDLIDVGGIERRPTG